MPRRFLIDLNLQDARIDTFATHGIQSLLLHYNVGALFSSERDELTADDPIKDAMEISRFFYRKMSIGKLMRRHYILDVLMASMSPFKDSDCALHGLDRSLGLINNISATVACLGAILLFFASHARG